jgi:VWFA-related protein
MRSWNARRFRGLNAGLLVLSFLAGLALWAQEAQKPAPAQQPDQQEDVPLFRTGVDVVSVFFTVKKGNGLVPNLKKDDFTIAEDGKPQKIKYFSSETNLPLTLGMLLDTSGSMQAVLPAEKEVGAAFVREVLREKDLAFLINFDVNVELMQDMTSSSRDIARAMQTAKINTGGGGGYGVPGIGQGPIPIGRMRGTALYDAVYLASREKLSSEVGRKAMIILTDGYDTGSKVNLRDAIEAAQRSDSMCYVLLVSDPAMPRNDGDMKKLTEETGGRLIDVGHRADKMKEAFDRISEELRSQYSLGYTPTNEKKDNTFRRVEIKTPAGKVQARKGYYAFK